MEKKNALGGIEEKLILCAATIAIVLTIVSVVMKLLKMDTIWINNLSYFIYGWAVCLGAAVAAKTGAFMAIDIISAKYPESTKLVLKKAGEVVMTLIWLFLVVFSCKNAIDHISEVAKIVPNPGKPDFIVDGPPLAIAYFAPVVGYAFAFVRSIQRLMGKEAK